jgi:Zn-dependent dipeptidase, microsomal dipeptidase homolog
MECYLNAYSMRKNRGQLDLESMVEAGALAQIFAIYLPSGQDALKEGIQLDPYSLFHEIYKLYQHELSQNRDLILPALSYQDIISNRRAHRMSAILSIEDCQLLDGNLKRLRELYEKGVRLITLLWNKENCIGYPNSSREELHQKGLKPFGIEVVRQMNKLGMIIDVSHMSEGGFYDVVKYSEKPFVASHSCARALCDNQRNLSDHQLKCIAGTGGVVGVNYNSEFLRKNSTRTTIEDIVRHIDYMISIMGSDCVALGSDFDGVECDLEPSDYSQYGNLISELEKKFSDDVVEKICYKNVLRIIQECL